MKNATNRPMEPVAIWPNITIVVKAVLQKIPVLTKLQHIVSNNRVTVQKNVVISNIHMQIICDIPVLFEKRNCHSNFIHTSHVTRNNPFLSYLHIMSTNERTVYIKVLLPK